MRCLATLMIVISIACPASAKVACENPNPEVVRAVRTLTAEKSRSDRNALARLFDFFSAHPREAACPLVNELKVVKVRTIRPWEVTKHRSAMHVIWSLRALRYIAGCLEYYARTKE